MQARWTPFVNYSRQNENLNALSNKWLNSSVWELLTSEPTTVSFHATAQTCDDSRRATEYIIDSLFPLQVFHTWLVTAGLERFSHMCPNPLKPCELNSLTGPSSPSSLKHLVSPLSSKREHESVCPCAPLDQCAFLLQRRNQLSHSCSLPWSAMRHH